MRQASRISGKSVDISRGMLRTATPGVKRLRRPQVPAPAGNLPATTASGQTAASPAGFPPHLTQILMLLVAVVAALVLVLLLRRRRGGERQRALRSEEHTSELQSLMRLSY